MGRAGKIIAGVAAVVVGAFTGQGWLISAGVSLTASGISDALRKSSGRSRLASEVAGWTGNPSSSDAPLPVIYGRAHIGPRLVDARVDRNSANAKDLAWVGAIAVAPENGGGIEEIEKVWLDDTLAIDGAPFGSEPRTTNVQSTFSGYLKYGAHAGTDAQTVDAELNSRFGSDWTSKAAGFGIAYLALFLTYSPDKFPSGIPRVKCQVKGQKVYDPRTDTWAWSDNPALCVLDYLTSKRYGIGAAYSERDGGAISEIDEASFEAAANYSEENVSTPAGNQQRFRCNGIVDTSASHAETLSRLLTSCRGDLVWQAGKFRLVARKTETAETFKLTEANITGGFEFYKGGFGETGNIIAATFVDADANYQAAEVVWPESDQTNAYLANDNNWERRLSIDLPFTTELYMAQQIAMTVLKESRQRIRCSLTAKEEALKLQVGEVVKVTHPTPDWTEKLFRVAAIGINPDATVRLALQEYSADAYSLDTLNTKDTLPDADTLDPRTVAAPTALALTSDSTTALSTQDGQKVPRILVGWTAADEPLLHHYELQWKVSADSDYTTAAPPDPGDVSAHIGPVTDGVTYDVRLRAVNTIGVKGDWVSGQIAVGTDEAPAAGNPQVLLDGKAAKVYPRFGTARSFKYIVDVADGPTVTETRAGTLSTIETGVTVHTFTAAGETVYAGVLLYTDAGGSENESQHFVFPVTYAQGIGAGLELDGDGDIAVDFDHLVVIAASDPTGAWVAGDKGRIWVDTS